MDKLRVIGGRPLEGEVRISGAKNAALPMMCAALLSDQPLRLANVPRLMDTATMAKLLGQLGAEVERSEDEWVLHAKALSNPVATYELVKTMRASILVLGPLLARCGEARVSLPGGCAIGLRPVDQHVKDRIAMGAQIDLDPGYINAHGTRLAGAKYLFDVVTVTGTENLMMAATLANGVTMLENAAHEPEIVDLALCLNAMGARVAGAGSDRITIEGVERLHAATHAIMPDRIETGTFIAAAAAAGGDVAIVGARPDTLEAVRDKLAEAGADIASDNSTIRVRRAKPLRCANIRTAPYPSFPTDMQAQFMALATIADGTSVITETIFENWMIHVKEL